MTAAARPPGLALEVAAYDDPRSLGFVEAVQAFSRERHGGRRRRPPGELTPADPADPAEARPRHAVSVAAVPIDVLRIP